MKTTFANIDITVEDLDKAREVYGENYDVYEPNEPERYDYFKTPTHQRRGYFDYEIVKGEMHHDKRR